ncbi:ABC transporter substrate-binding protein [Herbiconiux sp. CPCC 205763]|uniref:ABC transporter substrate-binding protein n=1 Tax=Herbiconiux aconitum TaxID=2970913 RepID=A0ABT2GPU1_9MICO|nr:ABC transporter substrate-binding protein [Herbiconiux aconitum]MCS5718240.1 ABC transporter substrate-binding protein [Herbiconiux aconitum]
MTHSHRRARGKVARAATLTSLVVCIPLALTACFASSGPEASPVPTPVASMAQPIPTGDGTLTIGAVVPLSGANAALGAAELAGVELAARDIDEAGGVHRASIIVVRGDAGDSAGARGSETVAALGGRGVDAIVGPSSADVLDAVDAAAAAAGIPGISAVADPVAVDEAFAARLRSSDPTLVDTRFGAESYDATVIIALAAQMAGDDGRSSIAEFLPAVTSGEVGCSSYGACVAALEARATIHYTGVTGQVTTDAGATKAGSLRLIGLRG